MFETSVFIRNDRYLDLADFIDREATLNFWRENRVSKIYVFATAIAVKAIFHSESWIWVAPVIVQ